MLLTSTTKIFCGDFFPFKSESSEAAGIDGLLGIKWLLAEGICKFFTYSIIPEFLKWTLPVLDLDLSTDANSLK